MIQRFIPICAVKTRQRFASKITSFYVSVCSYVISLFTVVSRCLYVTRIISCERLISFTSIVGCLKVTKRQANKSRVLSSRREVSTPASQHQSALARHPRLSIKARRPDTRVSASRRKGLKPASQLQPPWLRDQSLPTRKGNQPPLWRVFSLSLIHI